MSLPENIESRIKLLEEKFNAMGQDLTSYLDGLLYADYLTYWDYIHLDTLLSLQSPKTKFPDEEVFIMYHQITELYFKLAIHEFKQISHAKNVTVDFGKRYFPEDVPPFSGVRHSTNDSSYNSSVKSSPFPLKNPSS